MLIIFIQAMTCKLAIKKKKCWRIVARCSYLIILIALTLLNISPAQYDICKTQDTVKENMSSLKQALLRTRWENMHCKEMTNKMLWNAKESDLILSFLGSECIKLAIKSVGIHQLSCSDLLLFNVMHMAAHSQKKLSHRFMFIVSERFRENAHFNRFKTCSVNYLTNWLMLNK